MKSAAQSLYPHLPSAERPERGQGGPKIADAMWPALTREELTPDERWWERRYKQMSDNLLQRLRQHNAKTEERR